MNTAIILDIHLLDALEMVEAKKIPTMLDTVPRTKMLRELYPNKLARDAARQILYRALVRARGAACMHRR